MVCGLLLAALSFHFLTRSTGGRLDPNASYSTSWIAVTLSAIILFVASYSKLIAAGCNALKHCAQALALVMSHGSRASCSRLHMYVYFGHHLRRELTVIAARNRFSLRHLFELDLQPHHCLDVLELTGRYQSDWCFLAICRYLRSRFRIRVLRTTLSSVEVLD